MNKKFYTLLLLSLLLLTEYAYSFIVPKKNTVINSTPPAISNLKQFFLSSLQEGGNISEEQMLKKAPLIISPSPYELRLILPNKITETFRINNKLPALLLDIVDIPFTIYNFLVINENEDSKFSQSFQQQLQSYLRNLSGVTAVVNDSYLPVNISSALITIITETQKYLKAVLHDKKISVSSYNKYYEKLNAVMNASAQKATMEQLTQFYDHMKLWESKYPKENWKKAYIILMGYHSSKSNYPLMYFFKWFGGKTNSEFIIDFIEFTFPISLNKEVAMKQAIDTFFLQRYFPEPTGTKEKKNKVRIKNGLNLNLHKIIKQLENYRVSSAVNKHKIL